MRIKVDDKSDLELMNAVAVIVDELERRGIRVRIRREVKEDEVSSETSVRPS